MFLSKKGRGKSRASHLEMHNLRNWHAVIPFYTNGIIVIYSCLLAFLSRPIDVDNRGSSLQTLISTDVPFPVDNHADDPLTISNPPQKVYHHKIQVAGRSSSPTNYVHVNGVEEPCNYNNTHHPTGPLNNINGHRVGLGMALSRCEFF